MGECVLTEIKPRRDIPFIGLRNIETGEGFSAYINPDSWDNIFVAQCSSHEQRMDLKRILEDHFPDKVTRLKNAVPAFNILQFKAPIRYRHVLKDLSQLLPEDAEQEFIEENHDLSQKIKRGHHTEQLRNRICHRGTKIMLPEQFFECYNLKKEFDEHLARLRNNIAQELPDYKTAYHTRIFNILNDIFFDENTNLEEKLESAKKNTFTKKLSEAAVDQRVSARVLEEIINQHYKTTYNKKEQCLEIVLPNFNQLSIGEPLSYKEIMQQKWLFMDIEIPNFRSDNPTVSWVGMSFLQKGKQAKEMHTLRDFGKEKYKDFRMFYYDTEEELVNGVRKSILEQNPYFVSTYNTRFDLLKLREAEGDFYIGDRQTPPLQEVSLKFFERIGIYGREVVDLLKWAQIALSFLPNQKLVTVAKHLFGDEEFDKEITYDELEDFDLIPEKYETVADYLTGDVDILPRMFETSEFQYFLRKAVHFGKVYNVPLSWMFYSDKSINHVQERGYAEAVGISRNEIYRQGKKAQQREQRCKDVFKSELEKKLGVREKPGLYKDVKQAFLPFGLYLRGLLKRRFPMAKMLYEEEPETECVFT